MAKHIERECKKHGLWKHRIEIDKYKNTRYRCCKCGTEAVQKRREQLKKLAVAYKGGRCEKCSYNKCIQALHFHHENEDKEFGISSKGYTRSFEKVKKEIDKCILLCANCHAEEHVRLNIIGG